MQAHVDAKLRTLKPKPRSAVTEMKSLKRKAKEAPLDYSALTKQIRVSRLQVFPSHAAYEDDFDEYYACFSLCQKDRWRLTRDCLMESVTQPLSISEFNDSTIYVYKPSPGSAFRKVGHTRNPLQRRMNQWWKKCLYEPLLVCATDENYPHGALVEKLVHTELKDVRYCEQECRGCHSMHREWFKVDDAHLMAVINKWTNFSRTSPYELKDGQLQLKPERWSGLHFWCTPV